ncbi:Protein kinase, catalytic domain-containing protein [Artemisia annua]|nr:Protein kinase, catalytic domain-containing protein [Artemisia annua]
MAVNASEPSRTRRTNSPTVRTTSNRSQPLDNNTTYLSTNTNTNTNTNNSYSNNNNNNTSYTPQSNTNNSSSSRSSSSYILNSSTATAEASISSLSSLRNTLPENTHIYDISEIRTATNNFLAKRFSTSSTAPAWRCSLRGREVVLFQRKVLRPIQDAELREKLSVIYKSHHINVVKLLGATIAGGYIYLAYDYMTGANLADCLRNKRNPEFTVLSTWMSRMQIITDLASGLDYIHNNAGLKVNLVHKYVKSSSVIVTEPSFNAKICHFGTAELCGETVVDDVGVEDIVEVKKLVRSDSRTKRFEGVNGYMSPEFCGLATQKSDVYAFGVVVLEVLTGEEPVKYKYDKASGNHMKIFVVETARLALESGNDGSTDVEGRLRRWVDRRLKDSFPVVVVEKLTRIALDCVEEDPSKRPNMSRVAGKVSKLYLDSRKWADTIRVPNDFTASFAPR